jgi:transposase-like protein
MKFFSYKDIKKLMADLKAVRRLIYSTNAMEGFNRQLRKVTKSKTVLPSDDSLLKMLIWQPWISRKMD